MAVNTMPQKRFKYIIENGVTQTELDIDPKGWDGHEVGFERSNDFGINIQNVVPLSFSGAGRNILKGVYENNGIFGQTRTLIEKRQNDWTYAPFYAYKHDYSTYKDNLHYIEIAGLEDGLAKKFDTYKDTEYEIPLPATNDKIFIDYTGASYTDKNTIQCGYGKMSEKDGIGDDFYVLKGDRSVRSYTDKLAFTDSDGVPYETMTFRALQTATIPIDIFMNVSIEADAYFNFSTPASGSIFLVKHNADFTSPSVVVGASQINPYTSATPANNRIDYFNEETTWNISVVKDGIYSFFYSADVTKNYDGVNILEGSNCRVEFSILTESAYQNAKLEAFTYEWLIEQLLLKIDSNAVFASTVTYPNVKELISCTPCIKNMGSTTGTGKIKTTLKDVLESFNKLKCIAIDITGNNFTISNRSAVYPTGSSYGLITVNNIVVEHSTEHQYNKITVGADTDDRQDDDPLVYPFICKKEFSVENSLADAELDLVNNFMLDPYAIDKYIRETNENSDNKDECEFMVFAVGGDGVSRYAFDYIESEPETVTLGQTIRYVSQSKSPMINKSLFIFKNNNFTDLNITKSLQGLFDFNVNYSGEYTLILEINMQSITTVIKNMVSFLNEELIPIGGIINYSETIDDGDYAVAYRFSATFNLIKDTFFNPILRVYFDKFIPDIEIFFGNISFFKSNKIYKSHTITGTTFKGDAATIYNIPLTPKRILDRWKQYLAISVVGATTKKLTYGTATILNSAITSKCDYEAASVVENSDLILAGVTPLFLPTTISADTSETILDIETFEDNDKYKYFSLKDEKTNKTYQGWINSVTFALAKNKSKQIMLQAKSI